MSGLSGSLSGAFSFVTPSGLPEHAVFRNGFQYTLLTRGTDIRRQPGITIQDVMNNAPNTCTFVIDGESNAPTVGELVEIRDSFDGDRRLFAGTVQSIVQNYEGQIDQLSWTVTCVDFTWLLNRRRPFGAYTNVSASDIVTDLVAKYAPGFTVNHVQTLLAKISIQFNGNEDFGTCLSRIAQAIGGGHWDVDYDQDVHFFHVVPAGLTPPIVQQLDLGSHIAIAQGNPLEAVSSFTFGFYFLRHTFVYSDGSESSFGPISNVILMDGAHAMAVSDVPIGPPLGSLTCVKRRVYFNKFVRARNGRTPIETIEKCCEIGDNTTTAFSWLSGSVFSLVYPTVYAIDATVPTPSLANPGHPAAPTLKPDASLVRMGPQMNNGVVGTLWKGGSYQFKTAFLYRDGSVSFPSEGSNVVKQLLTTGYSIQGFALTNLALGPTIADNDVVARFVYFDIGKMVPENWNGGATDYQEGFVAPVDFADPTWAAPGGGIMIVPDNSTDHVFLFDVSEYGFPSQIEPNYFGQSLTPFDGAFVGIGNEPYNNGDILSTDPIPLWPNPDGPSLEDVDPPIDLTNDNEDLLLEEAGLPFSMTTDLSQVRNRVFVIGSGSTIVSTAEIGATQLSIADISTMSPHGGKVMIEDPFNGSRIFVNYTGVAGISGATVIALSQALTQRVVQGAVVNNFFQADDFASQKFLATVEVDKDGNPTDGVHEYTIVDNSLKALFQLYMRAYAELELFSKPIVTIRYSTRDPKTKSGQMVHVDMTDPPCEGDFLIQEVTIDQIHDESDQLAPRYTVVATSVRFELNDLLLAIISGNNQQAGNGVSTAGLVQTATVTVANTGFQAFTASIITNPVGLHTSPQRIIAGVPGFIIIPVWWSIATIRSSGNWISGTTPGELTYRNGVSTSIPPIGWGLSASVSAGFHIATGQQSANPTFDSSSPTYPIGVDLMVSTGGDITKDVPSGSASATITVHYVLVKAS